ncbi:MAG: acyl carrier protein [Hamadaea sp.]|nr:acyl carrier protein [Hamadaea sp.]
MTDPGPAAPEPGPPPPEAQRALEAIESTIRAVLGRAIGPDENFFEAGLTSLALVQLHEVSTRASTIAMPVTALFAHPNLRALRRFLSTGRAQETTRGPRAAGARRIGAARRDLRKRIRSESEPA